MFNQSFMDRNMNFYIHENPSHIGNKISNRTINFASKKKEMSSRLKGQYKQGMEMQMNAPAGTLKALSRSMELSEDEFMSRLDNRIREKLQADLAIDKLQQLFNIATDGNLNQKIRDAVKKESVDDLQKALNIVAKCVELLEGKSGKGSLGACLTKIGGNNFSQMGANLKSKLDNWQKANNLKTIKRQSLEASLNQLQNLANVLHTGRFKSGNELTANGLVTQISNGLISTHIAEGLAFSMRAEADSILHGVVAQSIGTKAHVVDDLNKGSKKITGKTDISLPNVKVKLEGSGREIALNIGISSKFYTGQTFLGKTDKMTGSFGSGSGGSLKEALQTIFPALGDRYLAYNYMVHDKYVHEMNDLIATRQLLRLFATSGASSDFSQYMLVNGKLVSMWQLVQYAAKTNLGLSSSMGGASSQGIVLSIPDRPSFKQKELHKKGLSPEAAAWMRSRQQNSAINKARITATLHMQNLAKMVS